MTTKMTFSGWLALLITLLLFPATAIGDSPVDGFGLIAHWPFDENFSSTVNNSLYQGYPSGSSHVGIGAPENGPAVGKGALRLASGQKSGDRTFVEIRHPLYGLHGYDTLTITAWYRLEDLGHDGMDARNFVWESTPSYSLAFGLRAGPDNRRDAEWWFLTRAHTAYSDVDGPIIEPGIWHHAAMVWNRPEGHCRFYHDGELKDEVSLDPGHELEWMTGFHIGNHRAGDGARDWDGWIDDVAAFDVELTPEQIMSIYTKSANGVAVSAANVLQTVPSPGGQKLGLRPSDFSPPKPEWDPTRIQGPFIGHVSEKSAIVWARIPDERNWTLSLHEDEEIDNDPILTRTIRPDPANDFCLRWELAGLEPSTRYFYRIHSGDDCIASGQEYCFETAPDLSQPSSTTLVFASCAGFDDSKVWTRMEQEGAEGLILMGDTPYIDTVELPRVRDAYRRFASIPSLVRLIRSRPFWGTWDDHDFGRNDSDGTLPGKEFTRQGFVEYRPNANHGENGRGVYTRFRHGPVEVFLLDARWFARTESSWADPELPTLLGHRQWRWLRAGLLNSTAPFRILATGMIWDDKENSESDDWGTYMHERLAIEQWIGDNDIPGVILLGGDIHVSRHLKYDDSRQRAGYVLHQFITSPVHDGVIPSLNVDHPALVWSAVESRTFLKIEASDDQEDPVLKASWMRADGGTMHQVSIHASQLQAMD
jgi:alkaline phosphatase D